MKNMSV